MPRRVYKDIALLVHNLARARNPRLVDPGTAAVPAIVAAIKQYVFDYLPEGITLDLPASSAESLMFLVDDQDLGSVPVNIRPSLSRAFYMYSDLPRCPAHPAINKLQAALMQATSAGDLVHQAIKRYEARQEVA